MKLLINPRLGPALTFVLGVIRRSLEVGPVRTWRWIRVLYPRVLTFIDIMEFQVWIPLVQFANRYSRKYVTIPLNDSTTTSTTIKTTTTAATRGSKALQFSYAYTHGRQRLQSTIFPRRSSIFLASPNLHVSSNMRKQQQKHQQQRRRLSLLNIKERKYHPKKDI